MCKFCELYDFAKRNAKELKRNSGINTTFKIVLKEINTKDRIRRGALNYRPMKLVYCPTCGRKL